MSVKAMALVWDLKCGEIYNGIDMKPNHKFVLVAYADHADHLGRNIYPAIRTISDKTGLDERTVQRMTHDIEKMGLLIEDGQGPRGTNKWKMPFNAGGDKLSPLYGGDTVTGDKTEESLGDNPSGDNPSGDTVTPELKELNQKDISIYIQSNDLWAKIKGELETTMRKAQFKTWILPAEAIDYDGRILTVATPNEYTRNWLEEHITSKAEQVSGAKIKFVLRHLEEV